MISALEEGIGRSTVVTVNVGGLSASCTINVLNPAPSPIDLGLTVNWGNKNLYAQTVSESGRFYTWANATSYNSTSSDVAMYATDNDWRLPTKAEIEELLESCTYTQTTRNGVSGVLFTSKYNSNTMFIPDVGGYISNSFYPASQMGVYYWSSTADGTSSCGYRLKWDTSNHTPSIETGGGTQYKFAIRPVSTTINQIAVSKVTVNPSSVSLQIGGTTTATLTATVTPSNATYKTVTWSSSNTSVATVSSKGVVTAVGNGSAIITATADGKSASCSVSVGSISVTSVTLNSSSLSLKTGKSATLTATVLPNNAAYTLTWTTSNSSVATVSDGVVTAVSPGTATIKAKAGSKTASCTVTVSAPDPALIYKRNYYERESDTSSGSHTNYYEYSSYLTGFSSAKVIKMQFELSKTPYYAYLGSGNMRNHGAYIRVAGTFTQTAPIAPFSIECRDDSGQTFSFNLTENGISPTDVITLEYDGRNHTFTVNDITVSCTNLGLFSFDALLAYYGYNGVLDLDKDDDRYNEYSGIADNSKIYYIKAYNANGGVIKTGAPSSSMYSNADNNNTSEYCWEWTVGSTTTREFATHGWYAHSINGINAYEPYELQQ